MAMLLVIGVMDIRAMAVVMAAITLERHAPAGERVARAIGAVVVAGLFLITRAVWLDDAFDNAQATRVVTASDGTEKMWESSREGKSALLHPAASQMSSFVLLEDAPTIS